MGDALAAAPPSSFRRFWAAAAINSIGSAVTAVAVPVLWLAGLLGAPVAIAVDAISYVVMRR
jgi:hypothetical protein